MSQPDFGYVHPAWVALSPSDLRVLIALALSRPRAVSVPALIKAYQPTKVGTDALIERVIERLQPAVSTFDIVIVSDGRAYRLADQPKRVRPEKPKLKPKPKPVAPPVVAAPAVKDRSAEILGLAERTFSKSQIAATLRVPYAMVERVLAGGGR